MIQAKAVNYTSRYTPVMPLRNTLRALRVLDWYSARDQRRHPDEIDFAF